MNGDECCERNTSQFGSGDSVSVTPIVPVYNDRPGISSTIDSLLKLSTTSVSEIIVVDNGSTDNTRDTIRGYADEYERVTLLIEAGIQGAYAARNKGIEHTTDGVLAFLDADETVDEGWLDISINQLCDRKLDYLGCRVDLTIPDGERTLTARYNAHSGFPIEQYLARHRYAPTCALFVRREVFEDVGLFDPRLISGGDMEFGNRVDAAGYDMGYCADAVVHHPVRSSFRSLYGKNVRVGRGHCQLQRYYPERYGEPPIPPRHEPLDIETPDLSLGDRLAFGALSTAMTAARASGYARELASPSDTGADVDGPPSL